MGRLANRLIVGILPLAMAVATPVLATTILDSEGKRVRDELAEIAKHPEQIERNQERLLRIAIEGSSRSGNHFVREMNSETSLTLLSQLRAPSAATIDRLAAALSYSKEDQRRPDYRKDAVVRALGRLGPRAGGAKPAIDRFAVGHKVSPEILERLENRPPNAREVKVGASSFRSWAGSLSFASSRHVKLVQDEKGWKESWKNDIGIDGHPEVDFSKHSVIVYFEGANGSLMELKPSSYEHSASSATLVLAAGSSDEIDSFADYPYLMLEVPKLRTPLTVRLNSWMAMTDGKIRSRVVANLDARGRTLTNH